MSKMIEHFKTITQIPHCSESAGELFAFLVAFAREHGYTVETDDAENILAHRGTPRLCLQAHYDMVCMGTAPKIETVEEAGWLRASSSSLGADNGIAIAMMMALMEEGAEVEFLLTSDEEIGLIGASALALEVRASQMLNLDSEEEAVVTIGCAGGADIIGEVSGEQIPGSGVCYEVAVRGLPGGHSGVDIDRGIPSAIKVLFAYLHDHGVEQIASVIAGQRRNAIPSDAIAIVRSDASLDSVGDVQVRLLSEQPKVYAKSRTLIEWVHEFKQGVRTHNETLGTPQTSINLALINDAHEPQGLTIETSARAMSMEDLDILIQETVAGMDAVGFSVRVEDRSLAWRPEENAFTRAVAEVMKAEFGTVEISAIHAGLECGILSQRFPQIEFASIGPTIHYPHSTREEVDVASVERTYRVVKEIVAL
jgi:dipeptidase D